MKTLKEQFAANEITIEEYVAALEVENKVATDKLRKQSSSTLRLKVSEKGGLSIYGLGRFPVTLYKSQWERLLGFATEIYAFLKENDEFLVEKGEVKAAVND